MELSTGLPNRLGAPASELLEWICLIEKNSTALKQSPCHVRIEEMEQFNDEIPSWRIIIFQKISDRLVIPIHTYEDSEGRDRGNLKEVLQKGSGKAFFVFEWEAEGASHCTIRDNYVYLIHQSAKDYLNDVKVSAAIFPSGPSAIHHHIFRTSLQSLSSKLRRNIYNHDNPGAPVSEIATLQPCPDPLFDLRYSCTYWLDHFINSTSPEASDNQISGFFTQHLLHWLESLSLVGELRHGIMSLKKLSAHHTQHHAIVKEAEKFASTNAIIIQEAPLQTYSTALIFCPQGSLSKRLYWDQRFNFIKQAYVMQESWDPCIQVLEGHGDSVKAVAFSPDGQTIASASIDKTIRLWDTATGAEKQTLKGHGNAVYAVAFSPDGQTIASASMDRTIRLWDTATGAEKQTLKGHGNAVYAVAFSPDGQTIASASMDKTIRLWDTATGAVKQTLKGHEGVIATALWFSANGCCLNSDRGSLSVDFKASDSTNNLIFVHEKWIHRNRQHLIWLPPQYRATCVLVRENTVILGHQSGALTFLWLT